VTRARWTFVVLTALALAVAWLGRHHTCLRWGGALSALSLCVGYLVGFGRSLARPRLNLVGPRVPQARRLSDLAAELAARQDRRDGWINLLPLVVLLAPALAWAQPAGTPEDCVAWLAPCEAQRWYYAAGDLVAGLLLGAALGVWGLLRWLAAYPEWICPLYGRGLWDWIGGGEKIGGDLGAATAIDCLPRRRWWWQALLDARRLAAGKEVR